MHQAQNTAKRHRINSQRNVCLKKNPADDNLTENELRDITNERSDKLNELLGRIEKFNSSIVGSNAYVYKKEMSWKL